MTYKKKLVMAGSLMVLIALLSASGQALEVTDETYVVFGFEDGTSLVAPESNALEAGVFGGVAEPIEYVKVILADGSQTIVPRESITEERSLEAWVERNLGSCDSRSECMSMADDYCQEIQPFFEAWPSTYYSNGAVKSLHTHCYEDKGTCRAECRTLVTGTDCVMGRNCVEDSCAYGYARRASCSGKTCLHTICKNAANDPDRDKRQYDICDPDDRDGGKGDAQDWCLDKYEGSSKAVKDAICEDNGIATCVMASRGTVECTRASDCTSYAKKACTYGVISGTLSCHKEVDCGGDTFSSTCNWECIRPSQGDREVEPSSVEKVTLTTKTGETMSGNWVKLEDSECSTHNQCQTYIAVVRALNSIMDIPPPNGDFLCIKFPEGKRCTYNTAPQREVVEEDSSVPDCSSVICADGSKAVAFPKASLNLIELGMSIIRGEFACHCPDDMPVRARETAQPDVTQDYVCGNGKCEGTEDRINCPFDCREKQGKDCEQGYVGEPFCDGKNLLRTFQTVSCVEQDVLIKPCEEACKKGECVPYPLGESEGYCGDDYCDPLTESGTICPTDCGTPTTSYCGDGVCNGVETTALCKTDCPEYKF
jgi:hypothetical protein